MRKCVVLGLAAAMSASALAVTGTIVTDNDSKTGEVKWNARAKTYTVTQKKGGANIDVEVAADDVVEMNVEKPAEIDKAAAQIAKGQAAAAVPALSKIMKEYSHLQWDRTAGRYLADAYLALNNPEKALAACKDVIDSDKSAAWKGELAPAYWGALLKLNKKTQLEEALVKAAASGDRYSSGAALTLRGDIAMQDGNETPEAAKKALIDGYLRVVLMYTDAAVAPLLRPEALYKAAQCFEKLGQSGRADQLRGELKRVYATSAWANK